jgi:small subunit ribosomal protein S6e
MDIKLAIGDPKTKKVYKRDVKEEDAKGLYGKKLGDKIRGESIGLSGYEFLITGGSDYCGFPMRKDVVGTARKKVLIVPGSIGTRHTRDGIRKRRTVCGNTVYARTAQLNLKVLQHGSESLAPAEAEKKAE